MKPTKQISLVKKFKANKGYMLPLFYKGSIIRIGDQEAVEVDVDALKYEPAIQLEQALVAKHIFEIGD